VDEAKSIKDKVAALQAYARLRNDVEMEKWLAEIKIRAVRRIGQLSADLPKTPPGRKLPILSTGGKDSGEQSKTQVLNNAGISVTSAFRAEKVAAIPEVQFEKYINEKTEGGKPVKYTEIIVAVQRFHAPLVACQKGKFRTIGSPPLASEKEAPGKQG